MNGTTALFNQDHLSSAFETIRRNVSEEIRRESKHQILSTNEAQYVEHVLSKARLLVPEIVESGIQVEPSEVEIPAERHSPMWSVTPGRSYRRQKLTFEVPFTGDPDLFRFAPSHRSFSPPRAQLQQGRLLFEFVVLDTTPERIEEEFQRGLKDIKDALQTMRSDVQQFEDALPNHVAAEFRARRQQLFEQDQIVASLGVPVKRAEAVPQTLVIPEIQQRKLIVPKPAPSSGPYVPEYKLDDDVYDEIVRVCHDLGVHMERHPSLYEGRGEEELRDQFLLMLSPHFHSTAGEVFNRQGKTDILIRHERTNVFVAECKFWGGEIVYHQTIDQLLSYLTWRDSCAAILCFNRNQQQDPVLRKIQDATPKHPCFVRRSSGEGTSFIHFDFHLPNDDSRGIRLAVLCFHFPEKPNS
jgi:hypothetical protein